MVRKGLLITSGRSSAASRCHVLPALARALAVAIAAVAIACGPSEPLQVGGIQTGKSLNSDNSIATHSTTFNPKDTMYVAVLTSGRGAGTIVTRWSLGGRVIHEVTKEVSYNDQAATDFRFAAADGFPAGEYMIEVLVDGESVGTRTVRVQ